jgi:hypothetical protein
VAEFDLFANQLLEEAKRFFEKATESADRVSKDAHLHAALMLSFCALEAFVNSIGEEFATKANISVHEKGLLLERSVGLENGVFQLEPGLKMSRLEDRIEFIHAKFSGKPLDRSSIWWSHLSTAMDLRNQLTHAKAIPAVSDKAVRNSIQAIIQSLDVLYQAIYKRTFPSAGMGLQSRLTF